MSIPRTSILNPDNTQKNYHINMNFYEQKIQQIKIALGMDASVDPFLIAISIGASCAFLTPIGHQSNTLVMGPGGYKFGDYWRMGLVLEVIVVVVAIPLILISWPF